MDKYILRVAADSPPAAVAGAIAGQMRDRGYSQARAIGMAAVYQMIKAVLTAQKFLEQEGIHLACRMEYEKAIINGQERQAIQMYIYATSDGNADGALEYDLNKALDQCLDRGQNSNNRTEINIFGVD